MFVQHGTRFSDSFCWVHEDFYESCIHRKPHSAVAMRCFDAYKASLEFGFSGSRGLDLPSNVQEELGKLKNKATSL